MAEATDKETDDVNCAVCMDKLTDARYLKCFHSFCTRCLEHCIRNLKVSCPLCREITHVTNGIDALLPNLSATRRVMEARVRERIETKIQDGGCQCESCRDLGRVCLAKSYCVDCQLLICGECVNAHKLLKMTRAHSIISVLEFQNNGADLIKGEKLKDDTVCERRCEKHGAELTMFCRPCKQFVCPQCAFVDHLNELNDHKCVSVDEIGDELVEDMRQILSKLDVTDFDRITENFKQRLKDTAEKAQELRSKINESAQSEVACLYAKVEAKRVDLNMRVMTMEKASSRKVTTALSSVRRLRSRAEKLDGYADELMKSANPADIMAAKDALAGQLRDIRSEMRKLVSTDIDFHELDRYLFMATEWMASSYEPGVGRLESCEHSKGGRLGDNPGGRFKRKMSGRMSRTPQRPTTPLPPLPHTRPVLQ